MIVLNDIEQFLNHQRAEFAAGRLCVLRQLLLLCEWLIDHPRPFTLNLQMSSVESLLAFSHPTETKQFNYLRIAFPRELFFLNTLPTRLFSSKEADRRFLARCIDNALSARKVDTLYFEPVSGEDRLFLFLDSDNSPLRAMPLADVGEDAVAEWVSQAAVLLSQFENSDSPDRRIIISIFLARYLFNRWHPKFAPENTVDADFNARREAIRKMTPTQANIIPRYVPDGYQDRPISELFQSSSVARAPLEWIQRIQFHVCPLDVAYGVFKVHESLTVMATLQVTRDQPDADKRTFYQKMPGFDDIFGLWMALLAISEVADPRGLAAFLNRWSVLPAFPKRFMACCAYLEASAAQIAEFGSETD
jgi:hypothetical protein